jgi:hypothetical protein
MHQRSLDALLVGDAVDHFFKIPIGEIPVWRVGGRWRCVCHEPRRNHPWLHRETSDEPSRFGISAHYSCDVNLLGGTRPRREGG